MGATAILFPGQGSQTPDMRETVARVRPDLLEMIVAAVGEDPFPRVEESTRFAQPAIFAASLALLEEQGRPLAELMAGHSLGELSALVAAGALGERDGVELVALRGRLMGDAAPGGMVALLGAGAADLAEDIAAGHGLAVANDNSPGQVVLSGPREALGALEEAAAAHRLRAMPLPVAGAFHSPLMQAAVPDFAAALDRVEFSPPAVTVLCAATAAPFEDPRRQLAEALVRRVRWRETVLALHEFGARRFVEVGPGRVLSGLVKRTLPGVELVRG